MSSRKTGHAALYELMGTRSARPSRPAPVPDTPIADETGSSWLSPGRVLRLPVGYVLLASALSIALVVTAYVFGYRQASETAAAHTEQTLLQGQLPVDPLGAGESTATGADPRTSPPMLSVISQSPDTNGGGSSPTVTPPQAAGGWGPIFSDPRQAGLSYYILMTTDRAGAERVVRFCRDQGLETYAVGRNNASNHRVIAFPGFKSQEQSSERIRALDALIGRIGTQWKRDNGGATDFHDRYPSLYSN